MTLLAVCLGGAAGAAARFLLDRWVRSRHGSAFPLGTLVVNVLGSLLLGLLVTTTSQWQVAAPVSAGLATGLCGALTTWSTLGAELWRLLAEGRWRLAAGCGAAHLVLGVAAAVVGMSLGALLG